MPFRSRGPAVRWSSLSFVLVLTVGCATPLTQRREQPRALPRSQPPAQTQLPAVPSTCFPIEGLAPPDRRLADRVLLEFGDQEGLYTLAGKIKPISSDIRDLTIQVAPAADSAKLEQLDALRRVANALTCGDIGVFVQVFTATDRDARGAVSRHTSMVIYDQSSVRELIHRKSAFFATLGITPSADPRDALAAVENAPRDARWRGYGYLFGYPDDAVEFFVQAGVIGDSTNTLVPRDFRRIDTFHKFPESRDGPATVSSFVYAVPKGAAESAGDLALRSRAAPVYARYAQYRERFIRSDSSGAVQLWRAWYDQH